MGAYITEARKRFKTLEGPKSKSLDWLWEYAARNYARMWVAHDKDFVQATKNKDFDEKTLKRFRGIYKAPRNAICGSGILKALNELPQEFNADTYAETWFKLSKDLGAFKNKEKDDNLHPSGASKLLWRLFPKHVPLYDSYALVSIEAFKGRKRGDLSISYKNNEMHRYEGFISAHADFTKKYRSEMLTAMKCVGLHRNFIKRVADIVLITLSLSEIEFQSKKAFIDPSDAKW